MLKKRISEFLFLLTAISLLTACQSDVTPNPDMTLSEESKVSETDEIADDTHNNTTVTDDYGNYGEIEQDWNLETDKTFVPAEELYRIEKKSIDADVFKKNGVLNLIEGSSFFFSQITYGKAYYDIMVKEEPVEKASVTLYDSDKGEASVILSEAPKDDEHGLFFEPIALNGSYLYFFRSDIITIYDTVEENSLWRVSLNDKTSEKLFTFDSGDNIKTPVQLDNFLYFYEFWEADLNGSKGIWVIYRCDMDTGETSVFRYNAERPLVYKNGIIYYHNGGFYYHGDSSEVTGKGTFYKGDELIFYPNTEGSKRVSGINSKKDVIIYTYDIYENDYAIGSVFGVFDENFNRIDIGSTPPSPPIWYITADLCCMSDSGLISVDRGTQPLIYDTQNDSFSDISIDGYSDYSVYTAENGLHFFAYETDNNYNYISAAMYTVTRK